MKISNQSIPHQLGLIFPPSLLILILMNYLTTTFIFIIVIVMIFVIIDTFCIICS